MIRSADLAGDGGVRPSVVDAMQACEKNSSAKDDSAHTMRFLPEGYKPGDHDVLCGRGRKCFNHAGNVKFRAIVQSFLPQYNKAIAKLEKSYILSDVVEQVRKNSGQGGFIKKDPNTGRWYEVGDFLAREKTSQAFRDVLHDKYKSSNTAKKKRRQEEQAEKLVRAHSNRSLGANSLDASSVHSVGSSQTGDYMLSDSKLMRMGMGQLERSDSILNLGAGGSENAEDDDGLVGAGGPHDDLLGGLGQDIANYGRPRQQYTRQRSLRAVLDFDTNRRSVMTQPTSGDGPSFYNRSSCPNLFAAPPPSQQQQQMSSQSSPFNANNSATNNSLSQHSNHNNPNASGSSGAPPISHIEIIQEETTSTLPPTAPSPMVFPDSLESTQFQDFDSFDATNNNSFRGGDTGSVASNSSSTAAGIPTPTNHASATPRSQQNWFHHSQPNLFGDAPPINPQGGSRRGYARQPPSHHMIRRPVLRANSGGPNGLLLGVQQQIGNLGLNDSNHGGTGPAAAFVDSTTGVGPPNGGGGVVVGPPRIGGIDDGEQHDEEDDDEEHEAGRHYLPHGLKRQQQQQLLGNLNASPSHAMGSSLGGGNPANGNLGVVNPNTVNGGTVNTPTNNGNHINNNNTNNSLPHHPGDDDSQLLARLQSLEHTGFGMDVIDENPFEPVPIREGPR